MKKEQQQAIKKAVLETYKAGAGVKNSDYEITKKAALSFFVRRLMEELDRKDINYSFKRFNNLQEML